MDPLQPALFDDDGTARPGGNGMVLQAQPGRPLSKRQKTFNSLIHRIEVSRARLDRLKRELDDALVFHAQHVQPRQQRVTAMRKDVVRALGRFLDDPRLKPRDRRVLQTILAEQLDEILTRDAAVDDDLRALFEQVHGADLADVEQEDMEEARAAMEAMFADLGVDVDLSDLHPGMTDEELAAKTAQMADDIQRQAEQAQSPPPGGAARRKTKREAKAEERMRRAEELRKRSIGTIYRQLAKLLHPDLEPDPGRREQKSSLMQELTAAYSKNDLHTLLRLELEFIHREESDVAHQTDEKLDAYIQILREQAAELDAAARELPFHPRYLPLLTPDGPFGSSVQFDGPEEVRRLELVTASLEAALIRLNAEKGLQEVRSLIRAYREAHRARY